MGQPVVHFEIIGTDPQALRGYYGELFGWAFDTSGPVAAEVSEEGNYGFVDATAGSGTGIPGGVGGGAGYASRTLFYVGVPDVEAALIRAEELGGARVSGPHANPGNTLVVGFFTDPEGHLVGIAGASWQPRELLNRVLDEELPRYAEVLERLGQWATSNLEDLLHIARRIRPSVEPRDIGLLESTAAPPQSGAFGAVPSSSQHSKAAALLHSVAVGEVDDVEVIAKRLEGKTEHRDVRFRPS